jgi:hypothetical protein
MVFSLLCRGSILPDSWQLHLEYSPAINRVSRGETPAQIVDDARRDSKTQTDPITRLFCRVKRLE